MVGTVAHMASTNLHAGKEFQRLRGDADLATHWSSYGYVFSRTIYAYRRLRGLTQDELAELSGIDRNTISMYERNETNTGAVVNPQLRNIYALALALDVPPAVLLPRGERIPVGKCEVPDHAFALVWPASDDDFGSLRDRVNIYKKRVRAATAPATVPVVGTVHAPAWDMLEKQARGLPFAGLREHPVFLVAQRGL